MGTTSLSLPTRFRALSLPAPARLNAGILGAGAVFLCACVSPADCPAPGMWQVLVQVCQVNEHVKNQAELRDFGADRWHLRVFWINSAEDFIGLWKALNHMWM